MRIGHSLRQKDPIDLRDLPPQARVEIHVEAGERVVILDVVGGKARTIDRNINIHVGRRAEVTIVTLVVPSRIVTIHYEQHGQVEMGGSLHWWNATLGGKSVEHTLLSEVIGHGGRSTVDWVMYGRGEQRYDLHVQNVFSAPRGGGEVTVKGVAEDHAHVTCRGGIVIGPEGQGTQTHLTQHLLMLDVTAKVDAVPALAIKTNDVKASHSATVSKIVEEDLFYMASRGIEREEARSLLIEGFLGALVGRIAHPKVQEEARSTLMAISKRKS